MTKARRGYDPQVNRGRVLSSPRARGLRQREAPPQPTHRHLKLDTCCGCLPSWGNSGYTLFSEGLFSCQVKYLSVIALSLECGYHCFSCAPNRAALGHPPSLPQGFFFCRSAYSHYCLNSVLTLWRQTRCSAWPEAFRLLLPGGAGERNSGVYLIGGSLCLTRRYWHTRC